MQTKALSPRRAFGFTADETIELQEAPRAALLARCVSKDPVPADRGFLCVPSYEDTSDRVEQNLRSQNGG